MPSSLLEADTEAYFQNLSAEAATEEAELAAALTQSVGTLSFDE